MRFKVQRIRARGVVLTRTARAADGDTVGDLFVEEHMDGTLKRTVRMARLISAGDGLRKELLPPLYDVMLVAMAQNGFTLTGFERIGNGREDAEFAQSRWCQQM